ncbi:MAG: thioredoxin family protein, partial [Odoribacter sp.]|nr:thioredoxin family protein [Odoribacter sp.]
MKKVIFIPLFIFISFIGFAQTGTQFMDNSPWKEVLKRAKRENKMIFVDCYTSWCGPCKQLAKQIFPQEKMWKYLNARFVNVKYDVEKGEGVAIEKMYPGEVKVYPTMLILNAKGELLHKVTGMHPVDELIAAIEEGLQGNTIYVLEKEFEKGNREKEFILKYLNLLKASSERKQYEKVARAYASQFSVDSLINREIWAMVNKFIMKY